jgi:fibronectin-binding autotransporter adhesin
MAKYLNDPSISGKTSLAADERWLFSTTGGKLWYINESDRLNNENILIDTKLSTYTGSTSITTIGTLTTGSIPISLITSGILSGTYDVNGVLTISGNTIVQEGNTITLSGSTINGSGSFDNNGNLIINVTDSGTVGTVTSVGLSLPNDIFSISGSPITDSGVLTATFSNQSGYTVFARGNGNGVPSFQSLVVNHLPNDIPLTKLENISSPRILGRLSGSGSIQQLSSIPASMISAGTFGTGNYTINGNLDLTNISGTTANFTDLTVTNTIVGNISGNASTATTWETGRTLTIGSSGKSVNGGSNVSWTLNEIGATTVGENLFTLANPSAVRFIRVNDNNSISLLTAADFRTAIGAGTSSTVGTVTSVAALTIGTTGTNITSSVVSGTTTPVITLNIPDASSTARGVITTGTQTIGGNKSFTGFIDITRATSQTVPLLLVSGTTNAGSGVVLIKASMNSNTSDRFLMSLSGGVSSWEISTDAVLRSGTVPAPRISSGTFGSGDYTFQAAVTMGVLTATTGNFTGQTLQLGGSAANTLTIGDGTGSNPNSIIGDANRISPDLGLLSISGRQQGVTRASIFMLRGTDTSSGYITFNTANSGSATERLRIAQNGNITMTGTLGLTGTRVSHGYFTDLSVTNTITGNISGNADTVTNGVYTTGNQTIGGVKTFTSGIIAPNGTVTAPGYRFTTESNLGIYRSGTDTIGFTSAGVNQMTINNSQVDIISNFVTVRTRLTVGGTVNPNRGPILTGTITNGGSGYTDGVYNDVALVGGTGVRGLINITVSGGTVTDVVLSWGGILYLVGDILTATFGGGSGFEWTVDTVKLANIYTINSGGSVIRLENTNGSISNNNILGEILFSGRDNNPSKSDGDRASIGAYATNNNGASRLDFFVAGTGLERQQVLRLTPTLMTSENPIQLPAGSVSAPAIRFSGDTNTGLYWIDGNNLGFSQNGTNRLTIGTSGISVNGTMILGTQTNKATITYTTNTSRTYTIPDAGTNTEFVMASGNQTIAGTKLFITPISGNLAGNAATASFWETSRTLTIGSSGKLVDGGSNVSWTLNEIGAAPTTHSHTITWTPGTTNGPTLSVQGGSAVAIPSAGASASGIITTGTQTIAGTKTFSSLSGTGNRLMQLDTNGLLVRSSIDPASLTTYETGTFTPSGTGLSSTTGQWITIGDLVFVTVQGSRSTTGQVIITNLPFTANRFAGGTCTMNGVEFHCDIQPSTTTITFADGSTMTSGNWAASITYRK